MKLLNCKNFSCIPKLTYDQIVNIFAGDYVVMHPDKANNAVPFDESLYKNNERLSGKFCNDSIVRTALYLC
jgi:hypothetical protein